MQQLTQLRAALVHSSFCRTVLAAAQNACQHGTVAPYSRWQVSLMGGGAAYAPL